MELGETGTCHILQKEKLETYMHILHVGRSRLLVLMKGMPIVLMSGHVGCLELRLQFAKQ